MARGHSNVTRLEEVAPYPTNPERASIPIQGGASVSSVKELPPLALSRDEWETIGLMMGWTSKGMHKKAAEAVTRLRIAAAGDDIQEKEDAMNAAAILLEEVA